MLIIKAMITHLILTMVYVVIGGIFHSGRYLESPILKVFFNVGPRMCKLRCTRYAGCTAFNFVKSHLYCELLNATHQATSVDKEHYMYSEMSTWTIESDTCWPNPCSFGETCVITNKDLPVCAKLETADYLGCYKDDDSRHLKHNITHSKNMSLAFCKQHCSGYRFGGLQAGFYCLCGDVLIESRYPKIQDAECSDDCSREPARKCGASWKNSIYLVVVTIIIMSISRVHGFYRLGQCPEFENCVKKIAIQERTLFNTLVQELAPGDYLGILEAAMELMCSNTPAVVQCFVSMTYEDCFQMKRLMNAYDSTDFKQITDGFCLYTDEISDLLRIFTIVNNRQWFFGCIEYMFMGITESKTGQTYLEYFRCSKDGTIPAFDELFVCFTEHMEGRSDEDIIIFVKEKGLGFQKDACSRAEKHLKQQIMNVFESFGILKEKLVRVKR